VIRKEEVLERARSWGLRPDVVEKDYVLGWLLAALARNEEVRADWIFKGGTCLKKCYFETYRFSEDLDFSLRPAAQYTPDALLTILKAVAEDAYELSGIELPITEIKRSSPGSMAPYSGSTSRTSSSSGSTSSETSRSRGNRPCPSTR
jgi:predicted nucleotidyltransferase component of viral defense system